MSLNVNLFSAVVGASAAGAYLYSALPGSNGNANNNLLYPAIKSVGVGVAAYLLSDAAIGTYAWMRKQIVLQSVQDPRVRLAIEHLYHADISLTERVVSRLTAQTRDASRCCFIIDCVVTAGIPLMQDRIERLLTANEARIEEISLAVGCLQTSGRLTQGNLDAILTGDPARAEEIVDLATGWLLLQRGIVFRPENRALLIENAEHVWEICWAVNCLCLSGILPTREIIVLLAAHIEQDVDLLVQGVRWLCYAHILTRENFNALMAGNGERLQEIQRRVQINVEGPLNQRLFDEFISEMEEREVRRIAEVLGKWNGEIPECHKGDLRIPAEVIGDIAVLGVLDFRDQESAIAVAEEVERQTIADLKGC